MVGLVIDEGMISTGVDSFLRLLNEKKRIELNDAAKELKLAPNQLKDWAMVLEENGVIKIDYQLTKIYLSV